MSTLKASLSERASRFRFTVLLVFMLALTGAASRAPAATRPNVVLILADDLGWTDLACFGSDLYQTPHLDKLARDGVKFTQNYSACTVCSPTRAALMTGKYPARVHITDWLPGQPPDNPKLLVPKIKQALPLEEATLAEAFKAAGYATASIGKWHLGEEPFYPDKQGFDVNIAGTERPAPPSYFAPWKIPTLTEGRDGEYVTDRLAEEAVKWIEAQKDKPFFLYLPHFAVHTPIQGRPDLVEKYRDVKGRGHLIHSNAVYAAMVESLDAAVGRVRETLEKHQLAGHTVIVFTSDNGGRLTQGTTSNHPLRAGKGSCYEGGTRVPMIFYWPGVTRPGSSNDTPVITMDLYPTLLDIAGVNDLPGHRSDGLSLAPLLRGVGKLKRDTLFWHYPHYQHYQLGGTTPYAAIRGGDFKLIEYFADGAVELYNLKDDLGERQNLALKFPARVNELRDRLHAWQRDVDAQMPTRNPAHDPSRAEYNPKAKKKK